MTATVHTPPTAEEYAAAMAEARDAARARVAGGFTIGHMAPDPSLILRSTEVTVTYDRIGREVIVIPDTIAAYMTAQVAEGWQEARGLATGNSRRFTPFVHMFHLASGLMSIYAASPVPAGAGLNLAHAGRDRDHAARGWSLWPSIVGASGWDAANRWWTDYKATAHLHPMGSPHYRPGGGIDAYVWEG